MKDKFKYIYRYLMDKGWRIGKNRRGMLCLISKDSYHILNISGVLPEDELMIKYHIKQGEGK